MKERKITIPGKQQLSHIVIAVLFSAILIFGMIGVSQPLQAQRAASYAPICNPISPMLQFGSTGAKVIELQRVLTQFGYGSLLGQSSIDGKFGPSTLNAVKKFQQDYRIPADGKVGVITWGTLCRIIPNSFIIQLRFTDSERMGTLVSDLAAAGGIIAAIYDQFKMFNVRFEPPPAEMEQFLYSLKSHPAVQGVSFDAISTSSQWNMPQVLPTGTDRVDAELSASISGNKAGPAVDADIAIIDSGVNYHPDLNLYQCWSFVFENPIGMCNDEDGHGTEVAGVAAANDNNIGVVGTAPGARIWALKTYGTGKGPMISDEIKALNFVSKNADKIEVVNLSVEGFGFVPAEYVAILETISRGVVVVVAAGNKNLDTSNIYPAGFREVITVSAVTDTDGKCGGSGHSVPQEPALGNINQIGQNIMNPDDFIASFSNFGPAVDLAAPGTEIETTKNTGDYTFSSGTSFAAPAVAGAAALYRSLHPHATPSVVDAFLKSIATKAPGGGNPLVPCDGAGRGYFNDRYPGILGVRVFTDEFREPFLNMAGIR